MHSSPLGISSRLKISFSQRSAAQILPVSTNLTAPATPLTGTQLD
jgi:hypothetical protein